MPRIPSRPGKNRRRLRSTQSAELSNSVTITPKSRVILYQPVLQRLLSAHPPLNVVFHYLFDILYKSVLMRAVLRQDEQKQLNNHFIVLNLENCQHCIPCLMW